MQPQQIQIHSESRAGKHHRDGSLETLVPPGSSRCNNHTKIQGKNSYSVLSGFHKYCRHCLKHNPQIMQLPMLLKEFSSYFKVTMVA